MKGREVLLVVLVVAIALGSGLIGLVLGRSSVAPASAPAATVGGQAVASGTTRLYDSGSKTNLLYEIDGQRIYQGPVSDGNTILFFDGNTIYQGANATGEPLYTVDGNQMFVGKGTDGPKAYYIDNGRVYQGDSTGDVVYRVDGERFREGATLSGNIVFQANKEISSDIVPVLVVLAADEL